jgi:hypothetical protein
MPPSLGGVAVRHAEERHEVRRRVGRIVSNSSEGTCDDKEGNHFLGHLQHRNTFVSLRTGVSVIANRSLI